MTSVMTIPSTSMPAKLSQRFCSCAPFRLGGGGVAVAAPPDGRLPDCTTVADAALCSCWLRITRSSRHKRTNFYWQPTSCCRLTNQSY